MLLSTEKDVKDDWEDSLDKFPAIQNQETDNRQSPGQKSPLEDDEEFDTNLPNINLKEIFSGTNVKTFTNRNQRESPVITSHSNQVNKAAGLIDLTFRII